MPRILRPPMNLNTLEKFILEFELEMFTITLLPSKHEFVFDVGGNDGVIADSGAIIASSETHFRLYLTRQLGEWLADEAIARVKNFQKAIIFPQLQHVWHTV